MQRNTIKELALIYTKDHAQDELTPEQFLVFFDEVETKMNKYYEKHPEIQSKWMY